MREHTVMLTRLIQVLIAGFMAYLLVACHTNTPNDTATLVIDRGEGRYSSKPSQKPSSGIPREITRLPIQIFHNERLVAQEDVMSAKTLKLSVPAGVPLRVISEAFAREELLYGGELIIQPLATNEHRQLPLQLDEKVTISLSQKIALPEISTNEMSVVGITANIEGLNDTRLNWYVDGIEGGDETVGTITDEGIYQAPPSQSAVINVTIKAISVVAPSYEQTFELEVAVFTPNKRPTANPGLVQRVEVGTVVTLDGSESIDLDGDTLSYRWTAPAGMTLSATDIMQPTFTVPVGAAANTKFTFTLEVNDGKGGFSEPVTVDIIVNNSNPIVTRPETNKTARVGESLLLEPSVSTDPNNDPLSYQWSAPEGITLSDPTAPNPRFTVPNGTADILPFDLIVSDGQGGSSSTTIEVNVLNSPPKANAGSDQNARVDKKVTLNASDSSDPNNDTLSYQWTTPDNIALSGTTVPQPSFTVAQGTKVGVLIFNLTVNDGQGGTDSDTVNIIIGNIAPIADAGADNNINLGNTVSFDGSGSRDVNNDNLTYRWIIINSPAGSTATLTNPNTVTSSVKPDKAGNYTLQLTVNDGTANNTDTLTLVVTIPNQIPTAIVSQGQSAAVGTQIILDGSDSSDPDGDILIYQWSGPNDVTLSIPGEMQPALTLPADIPTGPLTITLVVKDGKGGISEPDTVVIDVMSVFYFALSKITDPALAMCIKNTSETLISELTYLSCYGEGIKQLNGLDYFTALVDLTLSDNQLTNLSALSNLTTLTDLNLRYNQITDLSALSNLTALTNLDLSDNQITDLSILSHLTALADLNLSTNQLTDLSALINLITLTDLNLRYNQITDLSALSNLTVLINLDLRYNQIIDLSALSNLTALTNLDLRANQLTDLSALSHLTALTDLNLRYNQITDLSVLSNLTALRDLNLRYNQITDLSALSNLTTLTNLNLRDNQITDLSILSNLTALTRLLLDNNPNLACFDVEALDEQFDSSNGASLGMVTWTICVP